MDAIDLLKTDHRKVDKIFSELENGNGNREQLFKELATALTVHAEIERADLVNPFETTRVI